MKELIAKIKIGKGYENLVEILGDIGEDIYELVREADNVDKRLDEAHTLVEDYLDSGVGIYDDELTAKFRSFIGFED